MQDDGADRIHVVVSVRAGFQPLTDDQSISPRESTLDGAPAQRKATYAGVRYLYDWVTGIIQADPVVEACGSAS